MPTKLELIEEIKRLNAELDQVRSDIRGPNDKWQDTVRDILAHILAGLLGVAAVLAYLIFI